MYDKNNGLFFNNDNNDISNDINNHNYNYNHDCNPNDINKTDSKNITKTKMEHLHDI